MMNTRIGIILRGVLVSLVVALMSSCTEPFAEGIDDGYGYVQFKLYKKASYTPTDGTKAIVEQLDLLADAHKVKVTLAYGETTIAQTLRLSGGEGDAAEWGLRSEKLKLLAGDYQLVTFMLYDAEDNKLNGGGPEGSGEIVVESGGLTIHDITVNVAPRGRVQFSLCKDMSSFESATRAAIREYTFDEISKVDITVKRKSVNTSMTLRDIPCEFDVHFKDDDEVEDGYKTSSIVCDTLIWLPADEYVVTGYQTYSKDGVLLETKNNPSESKFDIKDNQTTHAKVPISLYEADAYIQDYYALREIWESLGGEEWYYVGEEYAQGANWNFNKDVDLWGEQPGVKLHSNGRVAFLDLSGFGVKGDLSPAIGTLSELVELYIGTHNDLNHTFYDPTLDPKRSLSERSRNRTALHGEWLRTIHTPIQMSEPCARALAENGISIAATSLYDSMKEEQIIDPKSGSQRQINLMDTSHGALCNGLRSLPEEIGNLTKLEYLFIANSAIETLPESVANLAAVTDLEIYNCPRMEKFPMAITQMPELVSINISNNAQWSAEEIYKGLNALATGPSGGKVQILYCRQNCLEELPISFRNMKKLGMLDLAYNRISKIHPLGKEVSFVQLYLDNNLLEEIPSEIDPEDGKRYFCGYDDVETFSISFNRLRKVPNIFDANSTFTMASVSFAGNRIDGFEGEEDGTYNGIKVETFTLSQNEFTKYPKVLMDSGSTVAYIILRANHISEIPKGSFTGKHSANLTSMDLSYNKISKFPEDMHSQNLPYLYGVDVSFNSFSEFPYEPLDSSGLTVLAVRSQRDSEGRRTLSEWPTGIGNHRGLRGLYLGSNNLGVIDDTISTLIYYLDISDNPNIYLDASGICYAWSVGAYILIYDKTQEIVGCSAMME